MILIPTEEWCWTFEQSSSTLLLNLHNQMQFQVGIPSKQLNKSLCFDQPFSLDDVSHYYHFLECLGEFPFSDPERVQIVLNAIAAINFTKPSVPNGRCYRDVDEITCAPNKGQVFSVVTHYGYGDVMTLTSNENASFCILISPSLQTQADEVLQQSAVFKVMNSKLLSYHSACSYLSKLA